MRGTNVPGSRVPHERDAVAEAPPGLSILWALGAVASVAYLSLLPLKLNWGVFNASTFFGLGALAFHTPSFDDAITNLFAYVPIGFFVALYLLRRTGRIVLAGAMTLWLSLAISLGAEAVQTGITERVGSWWDVVLNAAGTVAGVLLAYAGRIHVGTWITRWTRTSPEQKLRAGAVVLTIGLFAFHLAPFDFVTSTEGLHAAFRRAHVGLLQDRSVDPAQAPLAPMVHELGGAFFFALLCLTTALSSELRRTRPAAAMASGMLHGVVLAATIEVLQLFTASHVFDLASFLLRALASTCGAWIGVFVLTTAESPDAPVSARHTLYRFGLGFALMAQLLALALGLHWSSPGPNTNLGVGSGVLPLEVLWRTPFHHAVTDMGATALTYGFLSLTMALVLCRTRPERALPIACLSTALVALLAELIASTAQRTPLDITDPLIATMGAFGAVEILRTLRRQTVVATRR